NMAIQARVYLHMDNFTAALAAAETIINDGVYSLYDNDKWYDSWSNEFGSESIFEIAMNENEGDLGGSSLGYYLLPLGHITGASGWFMASDYYLDRLNEDPTDVRWSVMAEDETSTDVEPRFGSCMKYVGGHDMKGDKGKASATNVKVIRLSEIYLIAAEAALRLPSPNKIKAKDYLNEIRKRAPALEPATEATITLEMIIDEKSKELFTEGNRYWDMMRLGWQIELNDDFIQPAISIPHRDKIIDRTFYKTILPISQDEIDANPPIGEQQNPGYN
ncbi:MAG: RagB/SusD family nutrient uptake outer membrane protein, partial [Bacteroidales bacterium]